MPRATILQALLHAEIFTGEQRLKDHALLFRGDKIEAILPLDSIPAEAERHDAGDTLLVPGLIDLQVNGGGNVLFNDAPTVEGLRALAAAHRAAGTTRLLPTLITAPRDVQRRARQARRDASDPSILGLHFEGPHIARTGIHDVAQQRPLTEADLPLYAPDTADETILVTLAPESAAPDLIRRLRAQGTRIALGHTDAAPEQIEAALAAGATGFTHLFNAMGGLSARAPAVLGTALDQRDTWAGLIADGRHVHPAMLRLACRALPRGKLYLVSDAMPPAAARNPRPFVLSGKRLHVANDVCVDDEGRLGGAALPLLALVRRFIAATGTSIDEALRMASLYPATFLGREEILGRLAPGYAADILALDPHDLTLRAVWANGERLADDALFRETVHG
jgi:N-acetylglucosamine-6-phosphate deacetylase